VPDTTIGVAKLSTSWPVPATTTEVITPEESAREQTAASALLKRKKTTSVSLDPSVNVDEERRPAGDESCWRWGVPLRASPAGP
jgi:hypothetical protein